MTFFRRSAHLVEAVFLHLNIIACKNIKDGSYSKKSRSNFAKTGERKNFRYFSNVKDKDLLTFLALSKSSWVRISLSYTLPTSMSFLLMVSPVLFL